MHVSTLRQRQNGCHFTDGILNFIFLNENIKILIKIWLKFIPKGPINNIPVLVQIMAWRRPGDKPLSETMMVIFPTHICVVRPQGIEASSFIQICYRILKWGSGSHGTLSSCTLMVVILSLSLAWSWRHQYLYMPCVARIITGLKQLAITAAFKW